MRASSPTHVKSLPPATATAEDGADDHHNSWIVRALPISCFFFFFFFLHWVIYRNRILIFWVLMEQLHHPSALDMFDPIIQSSRGKQIVMFLDYDGTLSPIVADPDKAFMSEAVSTLSNSSLISVFPFYWVSLCSYSPISVLGNLDSDEEDSEKACQMLSDRHRQWQMQRQGTFPLHSIYSNSSFFFPSKKLTFLVSSPPPATEL